MFSNLVVQFERFSVTISKNKVKLFNIMVFLISLFTILDFSQSLPNGAKDLNRWNRFTTAGEDFKRLERHARSHHLSRRIVSAMVPIRERETTSLCTYEVTTDVNLQRIPDKIDRVLCRKEACKCVDQGDYRCTQLYTQLNVTYLSSQSKSNFEFELIDVEYACVCSRALEGSNVNLLEPVLVK